MPLLMLALACRDDGRALPDWYQDPPTDTLPQFYGRVPKNLVMISIDTLRKDHLDLYGDVGSAGMLTSLAENGVSLDNHLQCSNWTYASTSCTLLGRQNEEAGLIPQLVPNFEETWPTSVPFLASWLEPLGFYSVLSSTNGWLGEEWGNTNGYDLAFHPQDGSAWGAYSEARTKLDDALRGGPSRFFLHVHLIEPHAAYNPPEDYLDEVDALPPIEWDLADRDEAYEARDLWPSMTEDERALLELHLRARYAAEVQWMDDQIYWILADLDYDHLLDDTLVVVWSDHGEAFWEHGFQTHAWTLSNEETDGIAFFWAKNIVPMRYAEPTSAVDLVPTLLTLFGEEIPDEVTGYALGQAPADRPRFFSTVARLGPISGVELGGWKLTFGWSGILRLYDRTTDPDETIDLYTPDHPKAIELWSILEPQVRLQSEVAPNYGIAWPILGSGD